MTRRLVLAILLTVWAILLTAGIATYVVTRSVLVTGLDRALIDSATNEASVTDAAGNLMKPIVRHEADRFVVKDEVGRTLSRAQVQEMQESLQPRLLEGSFSRDGGGTLYRTISLKLYAQPITATPDAPATPRTIFVTYRRPVPEFDRTIQLLRWTLIGCGATGGVIVALIARWVARTALRPLHRTANLIASIDDEALDRRLDATGLPVELRPIAQRLNELLARLQDSFAQRKRFLAAAAHELRTPVAAMMTTIEVSLRRQRDAAAYRSALETSLSDAKLMRALVESLMRQGRAEIKALDEPPEIIDLPTLIRETVASMQALAESKQVSIKYDVVPLGLQTQAGRLRAVLVNLIGNAISYSQNGAEVTVSARQETIGDVGGVRIAVADTGPGIAAEHLPHVFEPFYRGEKSRGADGHLGLGLFLVKTHVAALGGKIEVTTVPNQGTTFTFRLKNPKPATNPTVSRDAVYVAAGHGPVSPG